MPLVLKIDETGNLLTEDGNPLKIGEDVVNINELAVPKDRVEVLIKDRLDRDRKSQEEARRAKDEENKTLIESYKVKLAGAASPEEKKRFEKRIEDLTVEAEGKEKELTERLTTLQKTSEADKVRLANERDGFRSQYERTVMEFDIINNASEFINPEELVSELSKRAIWSDELAEDGTKTGKRVYLFKVPVKDKEGKVLDRELDTSKAAAAIAALKPHWVKASNAGGRGSRGSDGGNGNGGGTGGRNMTELGPEERMAAAYGHKK